jgi:hypothetical protein
MVQGQAGGVLSEDFRLDGSDASSGGFSDQGVDAGAADALGAGQGGRTRSVLLRPE